MALRLEDKSYLMRLGGQVTLLKLVYKFFITPLV